MEKIKFAISSVDLVTHWYSGHSTRASWDPIKRTSNCKPQLHHKKLLMPIIVNLFLKHYLGNSRTITKR